MDNVKCIVKYWFTENWFNVVIRQVALHLARVQSGVKPEAIHS